MTELKRTLGTRGLVVHYISSVMGVGILVLPGIAYSIAGPASIVAWLILIALSYPFALIFARMSMSYPNSRGVIDFIEKAYGRNIAIKMAIFLLITLVVANPLLSVAAARYFLTAFNVGNNRLVLAVGYGIVVATVIINLFGIKASIGFQGLLLTMLILFIVIVSLLSLQYMKHDSVNVLIPNGVYSIGSAVIVCFFGFIGWENAAPVAEEVINPIKTFPKAILYGVILVGAIYFLMAITVVLVIPHNFNVEANTTSFSYLIRLIGGKNIGIAGSIVAAGLMFMTANAWTLGTSRFVFGMSKKGELPLCLAVISGKKSVPQRAIIALCVLYGLTILGLIIVNGTELTIINMSSSGFLVFFLIGFLSARKILHKPAERFMSTVMIVTTIIMIAINWKGILFCCVAWLIAEGAYRIRV